MRNTDSNRGFTIVELLMVIVVIAILAGITIVAFNGIQARAKSAQLQSALDPYVKAIRLHEAEHGIFPKHTWLRLPWEGCGLSGNKPVSGWCVCCRRNNQCGGVLRFRHI